MMFQSSEIYGICEGHAFGLTPAGSKCQYAPDVLQIKEICERILRQGDTESEGKQQLMSQVT